MSGWVAGAAALGTLASGALTLNGQQQQQGNAAQAMQMAQQNYLLQKRIADQQYELSTAGRQDARGNYTHYVPGRGWVTDVTPTTQGLISASDASQRSNLVTDATRGAMERQQNFRRRQDEGGVANSMLDALKYRYGAPTMGGVSGAAKIAGVTGANEAADTAKSAIASAALRSGSGIMPTAVNFANVDRGAVTGTRSALAKADQEAPAMYEAQLGNWTKNRADPYNMLATRASNSTDMPFAPENVSTGIDNASQNAANAAAATASRGQGGPAMATNSILAANLQQRAAQPNYGAFAGGINDLLSAVLKRNQGSGSSTAMNNYLTNTGRDPSYNGGGIF